MEWKKKIWLLIAGALLTVVIAWDWNWVLAVVLLAVYLVLFPLAIRKQLLNK